MEQDLGEMITGRVETPEPIIHSKGEIHHWPLGDGARRVEEFVQGRQTTYLVIPDDEIEIIPEKSIAVDVGIGYQASKEDPKAGGEKPLARK
jgi:hypothetical protein